VIAQTVPSSFEDVLERPRHPYTQRLVTHVSSLDVAPSATSS